VWDGTASWVTSYTFSYSGGTFSSAVVTAQFNPTAATSYSGNITITGGGLSGAAIAVTGTGAAPCSGTPTAGTASASPTTGGASTPFTLTVSGSTSAGGIQFQWQSSADNATWSDVSGATLSSYSFTGITAATYYRCNVTCSVSSVTSPTASIIVSYYPPSS